jgi:peptidoglycan/xylan/chitin deacetylase (PgdA/CDA1 family)
MRDGRGLLVAATIAALGAATALSLLDSPWCFLALAVPPVYVLALVAGVMVPHLALFAPVVCQGDPSRAEVALTFDDGPDAATTPRVLQALAAAGTRATFFVLGEKARRAPEVLRAIIAAGHDIGIHGETHDRRLSLRPPNVIAGALAGALDAVATATGVRPTLFRPPLGHVSPRTAAAARSLGLTLVLWSVRARDGNAATTAEQAARRIIAGLRPGAILLLHDAAERGDRIPVAAAALPAILAEIARRGLHCVTLSRLLREDR